MEKEITNKELYELITRFAKSTDQKFDLIAGEIVGIHGKIGGIEGEIGGIKEEMRDMKGDIFEMKGELRVIDTRLSRVEALMVTKDYLDDKLSDLQGRMVQMVDRKIALACL